MCYPLTYLSVCIVSWYKAIIAVERCFLWGTENWIVSTREARNTRKRVLGEHKEREEK